MNIALLCCVLILLFLFGLLAGAIDYELQNSVILGREEE